MLLILVALDHVLQVLLHCKLTWAPGVGCLHVLLVFFINDNSIIVLMVMGLYKALATFGILLFLVKIVRGLFGLHLLVLVHGQIELERLELFADCVTSSLSGNSIWRNASAAC